jgi:hypothetical protein
MCSEECYLCDSKNKLYCLTCFAGYFLSSNNTCRPDIACNNNNSCSICPLQWTLINGTCQNCTTDINTCARCSQYNISACIECKDGFYLNNTVCIACNSECIKCSKSNNCLSCKAGYYIPKT